MKPHKFCAGVADDGTEIWLDCTCTDHTPKCGIHSSTFGYLYDCTCGGKEK